MRSPKFKKLLNDKKAATAVALAILFVPMLIAASAVVDFSRIASARTLLQASVDSAAVAGAGAYQTSQSYSAAQNVAQTTYSGTGVQLPEFVTPGTVTIGAYCSSQGTTTQCGTGTSSASLSGNCPSGWNSNKEYCVVAAATVTLKNSLFPGSFRPRHSVQPAWRQPPSRRSSSVKEISIIKISAMALPGPASTSPYCHETAVAMLNTTPWPRRIPIVKAPPPMGRYRRRTHIQPLPPRLPASRHAIICSSARINRAVHPAR